MLEAKLLPTAPLHPLRRTALPELCQWALVVASSTMTPALQWKWMLFDEHCSRVAFF